VGGFTLQPVPADEMTFTLVVGAKDLEWEVIKVFPHGVSLMFPGSFRGIPGSVSD
jgi:hypothetical protein